MKRHLQNMMFAVVIFVSFCLIHSSSTSESNSVESIEAQPCSINNGGCDKLCSAVSVNGSHVLTVKCSCPYGEQINEDGQTCSACSYSWFFMCDNHTCIPNIWVCDGEFDCLDGSDEKLDCTKLKCATNQFKCNSGRCIPQKWVCDGKNHCLDKQDEKDCLPVACLANQFQCSDSGQCVDESFKCDGETDCRDGSDELDCPSMKPVKY